MKATNEHPYPGTFEEFLDWFPTEDDCLAYLEWIRWGEGFKCPVCEGRKAWRIQRKRLWECQACGRQSSVLAGTVFEDTRKPLRLWFHVIWLMMAQKAGMSAKNFFETFGFGSYQTSWGWLQKLRSVMVRPGREPLEGRIEVDETYIGGQKEGKRGRGAAGKTLVLVAVEAEEGKRLGRVRFRVADAPTGGSVAPFVADYIQKGATVVTDGLKSYDALDGMGYVHVRFVQNPSDKTKQVDSRLEHVHLVVSLLKRWMAGTHQGAITPNHLAGYLDEFAFRFNRHKATRRGLLFHRLLQQAVTTRPPPIKELYAKAKASDLESNAT